MKRLGERIRRRREVMQMQLSDLAKKTGMSSSALSQIENAKSFPSIFNLKAIADHLHTTVGELLGENETLSRNPLVKEAEKHFVKRNASGTSLYLLSHHDPHKQMETYFISLSEKGNGDEIMTRHPGQEFLYLLKGKLQVELEDKTYQLTSGDSFYFNANAHHKFKNGFKGVTELIWIITPHT